MSKKKKNNKKIELILGIILAIPICAIVSRIHYDAALLLFAPALSTIPLIIGIKIANKNLKIKGTDDISHWIIIISILSIGINLFIFEKDIGGIFWTLLICQILSIISRILYYFFYKKIAGKEKAIIFLITYIFLVLMIDRFIISTILLFF